MILDMTPFTLIKRISFLVLLLFPLLSQGQHRVSWVDEYVGTTKYPFIDMVEHDGGFYIARIDQNGMRAATNAHLRIDKKSQDLKLEKSVKLLLKFEDEKFVFLKFLVFNDKLFFLARTKRRKGKYKMILSSLDTETLLPGEFKFEFWSRGIEPFLFVSNKKSAADKLIIITEHLINKNPEMELLTYVLDDKLNVTFQHKRIMQLKTHYFTIEKAQMDESDNLYYVALESPPILAQSRPMKSIVKGHLYKINVKNGEEEHVLIDMEKGNYLRGLNLLLDNKHLYILGLYSEKALRARKPMAAIGAFMMKSSLLNLIDFQTTYYPIDRDILHFSLKKMEKRDLGYKGETKEMDFLRLKDGLFWGDNRILIVAEVVDEYYGTDYDYSDGRISTRPDKSRLTGDVVVFACEKNGDLVWMNNVPKANGDYLNLFPASTSHFMNIDDEKVDFYYIGPEALFGEDGKLKKEISTSSILWNNSYVRKGLLHTSLNYKDGAKTTSLVDLAGLNIRQSMEICPEACFLLKNNDFLIYAKVKGRKGMLGTMKLD